MTTSRGKDKLPTMTVKEFDDYVKEIVSTHISRTVIKPTGTTTITDEDSVTGYTWDVNGTFNNNDGGVTFDLGSGTDITIDGTTANINQGTKGAARLDDQVDTGDDPAGISGSDGSNKIESASATVIIGD